MRGKGTYETGPPKARRVGEKKSREVWRMGKIFIRMGEIPGPIDGTWDSKRKRTRKGYLGGSFLPQKRGKNEKREKTQRK